MAETERQKARREADEMARYGGLTKAEHDEKERKKREKAEKKPDKLHKRLEANEPMNDKELSELKRKLGL